jgi:hypothetical protein
MANQTTLRTFVSKARPRSSTAPTAPLSVAQSSEPSDLLQEIEGPFGLSNAPQASSSASSSTERRKRKRDKPRTGWYYHHMPAEDPETLYYTREDRGQHLDENRAWVCKYCPEANPKTYKLSGGSHAILDHLTIFHEVPDKSPRLIYAKKQQAAIDRAKAAGEENPQKRRKLSRQPGESLDPDTLEQLYVNFIASCNQSLLLVECEEFQALLYYLNAEIDNWLPRSATTATKWVQRQAAVWKDKQKQRLHSARSLIHIMVDLWSSPNYHSLLGVTASYVGEDGKPEKCVLAIKTVLGGHAGENIAKYVMEVIRDWEIASKLGYMNMDNATNNNTAIKQISLGKSLYLRVFNLQLTFIDLAQEFNVKWDANHHRIRCQGHIINLSAHSFLFATRDEELEGDEDNTRVKATVQQMKDWRKKGPLGKLHNINKWIMGSDIWLQQFLIFSSKRIPRDNTTRWNS